MLVAEKIVTRMLGRVEYLPTLAAMRAFTENRSAETADELWVLEHPPVYTRLARIPRMAPGSRTHAVLRAEAAARSRTKGGPGASISGGLERSASR